MADMGRGGIRHQGGVTDMSEPVVRIMCPNLKCRRILAVPASARGKNIRCGNCGANVKVPAPRTDQPAPSSEKTAG
jgi:hypothetical protein